jgi:uncharacterized SAM-binding protein YcdF (DUF218 family)
MFYVLSKVLGLLTQPVVLCLLLLAAALIWRRAKRVATGLVVAAGLLLYLLSTPVVADLLMHSLERPYEHPRLPSRVDAIVVLGGATCQDAARGGQVELGAAADRLVQGVLLAKRYPKAPLILSGGESSLLPTGLTEAPALAKVAGQLGVPARQMKLDEHSRNTRENAVECKKLLGPLTGGSVVLITSGFHMARSLACFRRVGLKPTPYAVDFRSRARGRDPFRLVPSTEALDNSRSAIREYVGHVAYRVKGYT